MTVSPAWSAWVSVAAIVVAAALALRAARRERLDETAMYAAVMVGLVTGMAGGAFWFDVSHGVAPTWRAWSGAHSAHGVALGIIVGGLMILRLRRVPVLPYADATVIPLLVGYAIARVGCHVAGDDFGARTEWAWGVSPASGSEAWQAHVARGWIAAEAPASLPVHPVPLLLAAGALLLAAMLFLWHRRGHLSRGGDRSSVALAGYALLRLLLEPLRDDFRTVLGPLALPQLMSVVVLVAVGGWAWWSRRRPVHRRSGARPTVGVSTMKA